MQKSVRKTASTFRLPDQHTTTAKWFTRGDGVSQKFDDECERKGLLAVRSFESWNANEGDIALALNSKDQILMFDGDGRPWRFTPAEALEFLALMCHECQGGDHYWGERYFYEVIAAALKGGAK